MGCLSVKDVDLIQCNQFLVIIDYFLGTTYRVNHALLYSAKHARFCKPGIVTFSQRYI